MFLPDFGNTDFIERRHKGEDSRCRFHMSRRLEPPISRGDVYKIPCCLRPCLITEVHIQLSYHRGVYLLCMEVNRINPSFFHHTSAYHEIQGESATPLESVRTDSMCSLFSIQFQ